MAKPPLRNPDRVAAILLFCALCGVLLGLGGRALRAHLRPRVAGPAALACPPASPVAASPLAGPRPGSTGRRDAGAVAVASPDGGAASTGRALWVLVLDVHGQPVAGAKVLGQKASAPSELTTAHPPAKGATMPVGELGVLAGPLPYPEDVISGGFVPPGGVQRGGDTAAGLIATTDSRGLARLSPLPPGRLQVQVDLDGKTAAAEVVVPEAPAPPADEASALRLVLRLAALPEPFCMLPSDPGDLETPTGATPSADGPEIAGRVEDRRGFAVSGARLELTVGRMRTQTIADPRGAFSVRGLPAGPLTVQARHPGFAPLTFSLPADKPRNDLRLQLQAGGGVAGTVRDARIGGLPSGTQLYAESEGGLRQAISIGEGGRFTATGLMPGDVVLRARAPGYAPLSQTVKVPPGERPDEVTVHELRLELSRSATLRGRISGEGGVAAGVTVTLTPLGAADGQGASDKARPPLPAVLTDSHGEFVATDLPPGRLRVSATSGAGHAELELEIVAGDSAHAELELR